MVMVVTDNALNVLVAKSYKGIGRAWIVKCLKGTESTRDLVHLLNRDAKEGHTISITECEERKDEIRRYCDRLEGAVDGVVAIGDTHFPPCRGDVKNGERPVAIFYRGNLSLLERPNRIISVIGLLNPDRDTEDIERVVVSHMVSCGSTILSGLALGCDTVAHQQAIRSGGNTIAALPSPIASILPAANRELAEEIVQNSGLLISEYYEDAKSKMELSGRYVERDRLQALFSDCVVLSASYSENSSGNDSGARHAMKYAASYSISRAVMYDSAVNAGNPKYDLNRQLIREDRAIIIIGKNNYQDAISDILFETRKSKSQRLVQTDLFG
jgi:DNA processing protein